MSYYYYCYYILRCLPCPQTLYDAATTMREKRLDCEEMLAEERRNSEALKKELEALQKKARIIDSSLKTAQNDLEAFQASQDNSHDDDVDNSNNMMMIIMMMMVIII